tara:strand:- start:621 stop:842 length:222 start_codon:yes stop_codon:yes gene_type:complete
MTSISDLELQELDGFNLKKSEMKALRCFRELRLKKLQNTAAEDQFYVEYENLRRISGTTDYRDFLAKNCRLSI